MAKVETFTKSTVVERVIQEEVNTKMFSLTLTEHEAERLCGMMGATCGDTDLAKLCYSVYAALDDAGCKRIRYFGPIRLDELVLR